jgi:trehalose 6-phosphate phosphatase
MLHCRIVIYRRRFLTPDLSSYYRSAARPPGALPTASCLEQRGDLPDADPSHGARMARASTSIHDRVALTLMESLAPDIDLGAFFKSLAEAELRILLLDYDGTLAPFTVQRDAAYPYPGVTELLNTILSLPRTRTVLVTGRTIDDLRRLLTLRPLPEMWGSHGWEHLTPDGVYLRSPLDGESEASLGRAKELLKSLPYPNLCEEKRVSVAAHWRGLPPLEAEQLRTQISTAWRELAKNSRMEIREFDGGLEFRPRGRDKGMAVSEILARAPESSVTAYLGDDLTDEDAFRALAGRGLRVLVRDQPRATLADVWARPPEDLLEFLAGWRDACAR